MKEGRKEGMRVGRNAGTKERRNEERNAGRKVRKKEGIKEKNGGRRMKKKKNEGYVEKKYGEDGRNEQLPTWDLRLSILVNMIDIFPTFM